MDLFYTLDLLGTLAFAISGAMVGIRKRFDLFGIFIMGFVTAVGGGTIRDVLIGRTPVGWMQDLNYVYIIIFGTWLTILLRKKITYLSKTLFLFDTIGLGIFTIIGTEIGVTQQLNPLISISLGTISASFGGVVRDILARDIPIIFRKEIYATACILGAILLLILSYFNVDKNLSYFITVALIISIRLLAVKYKLALPNIKFD